MPKLCDIVKPGVPCKVRHDSYTESLNWNGANLLISNGTSFLCCPLVLFSDDWHLDEPKIYTENEFGVGLQGQTITMVWSIGAPLNRPRALAFAAWIVALIDRDNEFPKVLEAVKNT